MPSVVTKPETGSVEWKGPPASFDQFVIERVLGSGGMGHVYLGRDTALDRQVALEFISAADPSPAARGRFLVEARAIAKLSHPNVVGVYRIGEVQDRPYIAYEFVPGDGLDRLTKPLPWETTLRLAVGLAAGLDAAHREGIVHRDIKPSNVVLSERGEVKLLDFGLAKLAGPDVSSDQVTGDGSTLRARVLLGGAARGASASGREITRPGTIMGTPAYIAPELWWGEAASMRSDIWALGLVLYELLVGQLPHAHLEGEEMAFAIIDHDVRPVRSIRPDVPQSFATIIERCLRRDADERFSSGLELSRALDEVRTVFLPISGAMGALQLEPERLAVVGGAYTVAAVLSAWVLAWLVRGRHPAFEWTLLGALFILLAFGSWLALVQPVNAQVARTLASAPDAVPELWATARARWEVGHLTGFILHLLGFAALVVSIVVETTAEAPRAGVVNLTASQLVRASPDHVLGIYADYGAWPRVFARTIKGVRLVGEDDGAKTLEIDHAEGRVVNVMTLVAPGEIRLEEWKKRYDARFTNRFEPVAGGTRYSIIADVALKGLLKALAPIARPIVRRRMKRFVLDPVKLFAERSPPTTYRLDAPGRPADNAAP